eukprot:jgi/Tetstr1/440419/TSEL_028753.t1
MAGGKKAGNSSNNQSIRKSPHDKTPKLVERTPAEATLTVFQALTLQFDNLSTLEEINKHRAHPATDDDEDESDNDPTSVSRSASPLQSRPGSPTFKANKALTGEEQVAERLIYSRVFDPAEHDRSANVVDGLLAALEDKRLEVGLAAAAKAQVAAQFKKKEWEDNLDTAASRKNKDTAARETRERERRKTETEKGTTTAIRARARATNDVPLHRFTTTGAWEPSTCVWWVSRAFFVSKPGDNHWRFMIDLRVLNTHCARKGLRMETLMVSQATATDVAPRWESKVRHPALTEMAVAERVVPPRTSSCRGAMRGRGMLRAPR